MTPLDTGLEILNSTEPARQLFFGLNSGAVVAIVVTVISTLGAGVLAIFKEPISAWINEGIEKRREARLEAAAERTGRREAAARLHESQVRAASRAHGYAATLCNQLIRGDHNHGTYPAGFLDLIAHLRGLHGDPLLDDVTRLLVGQIVATAEDAYGQMRNEATLRDARLLSHEDKVEWERARAKVAKKVQSGLEGQLEALRSRCRDLESAG